MGQFWVEPILGGTRRRSAVRMLVDTGATYSVLPRETAERLGIPTVGRYRVRLADGRSMRAAAGTAGFRLAGREAPATVLVGGSGPPLLGAETLEGLGLKVDPVRKRLEPTRPFAAFVGGLPLGTPGRRRTRRRGGR